MWRLFLVFFALIFLDHCSGQCSDEHKCCYGKDCDPSNDDVHIPSETDENSEKCEK